MREKIVNGLQKFSKALFLPILILPMVGLLIALSQLLTHPGLLDLLPFMNNPVTTGFGTILSRTLVSILNYLGLLFAVGITIGLADKKRAEAGFIALMAYYVFIFSMHAFLELNDLLTDPSNVLNTGQSFVFGLQVLDMGVFAGILVGCLTSFIHNRFADKEFDSVFQIYGGLRFVFIVLIPLLVILAVLSSYIWPAIQSGIRSLSSLINYSGNLGLLLYGTFDRLLIPTGLHHLVYTPFLYTSLGGVEEVGGVVFEGARNIYFAEMADSTVSVLSESVIWDARGISKMFGLVGASLAMYHTAKPENKARAKAVLLPVAMTSLIAGVTEPLEFSFMFISPLLFVVHSVLSGLSLVVLNVFDVRAIGPNGWLDFLIYNLPLGVEKTRWPLFLLVGLLFFVIYYVVFRWMITQFHLKTIGREEHPADVRLYTKSDYEAKIQEETTEDLREEITSSPDNTFGYAPVIVDALGGEENIVTLTNCYSRLRLTVKDSEKINTEKLKNETGASGVMIKDNNVHVVYGLQVEKIRQNVEKYIGKDTTNDDL